MARHFEKLSVFFGCRLKLATLLKNRLWHRCFPVNFPKFLRTPFLTEHCQWLLLIHYISTALLPASNYMFNVWHTNIKLLTKSNCLLYAVKFFLPTSLFVYLGCAVKTSSNTPTKHLLVQRQQYKQRNIKYVQS